MEYTTRELAEYLKGELSGDPAAVIRDVAALGEAGPADLVFVDGAKRLAAALEARAGCFLVPRGALAPGRNLIAVDDPKRSFAQAVALFRPASPPHPGVHPSAVVDPSAVLGPNVHIAAHVSVAANVVLGAGVVVGPGSVLSEGVRIGAGSTLVARVVVYPGTELGERVLVHAGAVLGSDGFGFMKGPEGLEKFPQVGRLIVEDEVEIGANTTIDRGALGPTVIGRGTKIDNLVHVAHNVQIGPHCAISAQVGIAGSSVLEERVTLAGQAGIADHVRIEHGAIVGAQAGVPTGKVIRKELIVWGTPARPLQEFKRQHAHLTHIAALREALRELGERLEALERPSRD